MKKGFTLIELVLVIAITGILAVSVVTISIQHKSAYIDIASKKMRSDIEHARGLAMMKKGTTYGVFFNVAGNSYTVYQGTNATPVADPLTKANLVETFSKWSGVHLTGSNYTVEFNSVGAPSTGGGGSVQVTDGTTTKTLSVTAVTGKVSLQ